MAAFDYAYPWVERILALKHSSDAEGAGPLAALLARAVHAAYPGGAPIDLIVPAPLTPARLQARGHNQAWELARRLGRQLALPARGDVVARWPHAGPQQQLDREARRRNVRGAFHLPPARRALAAGARVALVDDVMTTGATLEELALTFLRAGALEVHAWVLARAAD